MRQNQGFMGSKNAQSGIAALALAIVLALTVVVTSARAQNLTVLHNFTGKDGMDLPPKMRQLVKTQNPSRRAGSSADPVHARMYRIPDVRS